MTNTQCIIISSSINENEKKYYLYCLNDKNEKKYINELMKNKKIKNDIAYNHFNHNDITQNEIFLCDDTFAHIFNFIDDYDVNDDDDCDTLYEKSMQSLKKYHYVVFKTKNHALHHLINLMYMYDKTQMTIKNDKNYDYDNLFVTIN
jgi:hypothetical protein